MKTPDEIKKGLEYGISNCETVEWCKYECPYEKSCWPYPGSASNATIPIELLQDSLAYIQQLEAAKAELLTKVKQLEAKSHQMEEKNADYEQSASKCCYESRCNAQIKELEALCGRLMDEKEQLERERDAAVADIHKTCSTCKHYYYNRQDDDTADCLWFDGCKSEDHWEWRGVKEE